MRLSGSGPQALMFAHGYGCDQSMWRYVAPAFESSFQVILFDHVGVGGSDVAAYSSEKYAALEAYADDVVEIGRELELREAIFVGHSVSAMIGVLASLRAPGLFSRLILVGPSPRYINEAGYVGGFEAAEIEELLAFLRKNHMGWSATMAPVIMGNADRPELGQELAASFCRMDPRIASQFARVTFTADNRADLAKVTIPVLILQCQDDSIAPRQVGEYVGQQIAGSQIIYLNASGHCPNLSAPDEVIAAIRSFV